MAIYRRKFSKWKAFKKGLIPFIGAYLTAEAAGLDIGAVVADPKTQLPALGTAILAGIIPALINTWKNRDAVGNPFNLSGLGGCVALLLSLGAALSACQTTTLPDGTVIREIDVETAEAIYERYAEERERLRAERARADAARQAEIDRRLDELSPVIEQAWRDVLRLSGG